jgi:hypothetical protein
VQRGPSQGSAGDRARRGLGERRGLGRIAALAALAAALAACKSKEPPQAAPPAGSGASSSSGSGSGSAQAAQAAPAQAADWAARCEAALAGAPQVKPARRVQTIIDGCRPCGDWTPLLRWGVLATDGGPKAAEIEAAMDACRAFCKPEAKAVFLGALDAARGKHTQKPWRELGEACGAEISAKPDGRYMSAPYFALDRIARAAAAHDRLVPLLAAIELPLPPLSMTGGAFVLPSSPTIVPDAGAVHVTVSTTEITIGALPRARLGPAGVTVDAGETPYPGAKVAPKALAAALDKLSPDPRARITMIAPKAMAARRLIEVVAAAGAHELVLAAAGTGGPEGWSLPGVVPVTLSVAAPAGPAASGAADTAGAAGVAGVPAPLALTLGASPDDALRAIKDASAQQAIPPTITVEDKATVEGLAKLLGTLAYRDISAARLRRARP